MPSIVTLNVSEQNAPNPNTLQKTVAFVSQGATTNAVNSLTLLTASNSLASMLTGSKSVTSLVGSAGMVTATVPAHGIPVGDIIPITIAGCTSGSTVLNGTWNCTATTTTAFTFANAFSGTATGTIVYTLEDVAELVQMNNTFWAQGSSVSVNVLELGITGLVDGPPALNTYIQANPLTVYVWLVPREWDGATAFLALIAAYEAPTAMTYFFTTTTTGTYNDYTALMKCVFALIEAPSLPTTEFTVASAMRAVASINPGSGNRVGPFAFTEVFGVTPYPVKGNSTLLTNLKTAATNVALIGSEGGLTNTFLYWGQSKDGNDFEYWYSLDWIQINAKLVVANEIIEGSNNKINPLIYNQAGVDRLQDRLFNLLKQSVSNGLGNGTPVRTKLDFDGLVTAIDDGDFVGDLVVNAIPFQDYLNLNPSDYGTGTYNGLSLLYTPSRGFISILINLVAVNFG